MRDAPITRQVTAYTDPGHDYRRPGVSLALVDARYLAALEKVAQWAQTVWEQCYVAGADGWESVECVPIPWEDAMHSLGSVLAALPPSEADDA